MTLILSLIGDLKSVLLILLSTVKKKKNLFQQWHSILINCCYRDIAGQPDSFLSLFRGGKMTRSDSRLPLDVLLYVDENLSYSCQYAYLEQQFWQPEVEILGQGLIISVRYKQHSLIFKLEYSLNTYFLNNAANGKGHGEGRTEPHGHGLGCICFLQPHALYLLRT